MRQIHAFLQTHDAVKQYFLSLFCCRNFRTDNFGFEIVIAVHFIQALDMPKFEIVAQTLNNNQCYVPVEVIVETVYILNGRFRNDRKIIAAKLKDFIAIQNGLVSETNAIAFALNLYASSKLDFVDCLLAGYAKVKRCLVLTFDSGLKKELAGQTYLP